VEGGADGDKEDCRWRLFLKEGPSVHPYSNRHGAAPSEAAAAAGLACLLLTGVNSSYYAV